MDKETEKPVKAKVGTEKSEDPQITPEEHENSQEAVRPELPKYELSKEEKEVTAETTFTAEKSNGSVTVRFVFDGRKLEGKDLVAFEKIYLEKALVASHEDLKDKGQTVYIPKIETTAKDKDSDTHNAVARKEVTINDEVKYKNLIPGQEYKVSGILMDQKTEKPLLVDGKEVRAEKKFTPEKAEGSIVLSFTFDASNLEGETLVVFEDLYKEDSKVAVHTDIKDESQSIHFPKIHTTATGEDGSHKISANGKVTITDSVEYKNLIPGRKYMISGTIMDKTSGKALLVNGKEIKAEESFKADKADGTEKVKFTFDASDLAGKELVVFEKIYDAETKKEVANHEDLNDEGQTVQMLTPPKGKVQTGDSPILPIAIGAGVLLIGAGIFFIKKKKEK